MTIENGNILNGGKNMDGFRQYPENRLDIRIDENGNISYEENKEFAKYYAPTREELEEELEELEHELEMLKLDEPDDFWDTEHDDWEEDVSDLEDRIREVEEAIDEMK